MADRVVPLALNNRKLTVAMADPSDFATIDEISFLTGFIVVPVITPELRLVNALEKYYRIKRELRYIKVDGGGLNRARLAPAVAPVPPRQAAPATPPPGSRPAEPEEGVGEIAMVDRLARADLGGPIESLFGQIVHALIRKNGAEVQHRLEVPGESFGRSTERGDRLL